MKGLCFVRPVGLKVPGLRKGPPVGKLRRSNRHSQGIGIGRSVRNRNPVVPIAELPRHGLIGVADHLRRCPAAEGDHQCHGSYRSFEGSMVDTCSPKPSETPRRQRTPSPRLQPTNAAPIEELVVQRSAWSVLPYRTPWPTPTVDRCGLTGRRAPFNHRGRRGSDFHGCDERSGQYHRPCRSFVRGATRSEVVEKSLTALRVFDVDASLIPSGENVVNQFTETSPLLTKGYEGLSPASCVR